MTIVFHAIDFEELQTVMNDLQTRFPAMEVKRLLRNPKEHRPKDYTLIDLGALTSRQLQMLETAYEAGYFERPRQANATEIAAQFDIDPSTFREHVNVAISKMLDAAFID